MSEAFMGGGGSKVKYPLAGNSMNGYSGTGSSAATCNITIDLTKRYYINAAGANSTVSNPAQSIAGALWLYDGAGNITSVKSKWTANNTFSCILSGTTLTITNSLPAGYDSYNNGLLVTLIPIDE